MTKAKANLSFQLFQHIGIALDPIHVGTGGARLGRVDLSIVRDPVTRVPKIPGSSLAGVCRAYVAMAQQTKVPNRQLNGKPKPYYPDCAGLGQQSDGTGGHCGQADCPVCTVFGFARGASGGFAGLAAFSDAHVLLFPVATREGPLWVTAPMALHLIDCEVSGVTEDAIYQEKQSDIPINLGWLLLPVKSHQGCWQKLLSKLEAFQLGSYIRKRVAIIPDALFIHVVNSNLEVRTSVSINPETGAAQDGALFTYEALPRGTVLYWEVVCRNPEHFRVGGKRVSFNSPNETATTEDVHDVVKQAHPYLEHLGIGGMGTRGMGRLKVLQSQGDSNDNPHQGEQVASDALPAGTS